MKTVISKFLNKILFERVQFFSLSLQIVLTDFTSVFNLSIIADFSPFLILVVVFLPAIRV